MILVFFTMAKWNVSPQVILHLFLLQVEKFPGYCYSSVFPAALLYASGFESFSKGPLAGQSSLSQKLK
jgi:hypothetical protein